MSVAIEFNNISKQYRLGLVSTRTLSHDLDRWWKMNVLHKEDPYLKIGSVNDRASAADSEYVWALKSIDFKVEQGDVVGIIGKNGAGKSTLLKLLSKITAPTTGTINAKGRIGALLEVGTGFHPEMTGRENIYLNGAIMGMNKAEITRKLDEIIDFSGCERYIDTPVKRYSSGMTVRLGFAVAAFLEPEILVVDEVLAVGDAEFQKKAIGKMRDVSNGEGRTVLFVSHNMDSIKKLCRRGIVLEKGMVSYDGSIDSAVDLYIKGNISNVGEPLHTRKDRRGNGKLRVSHVGFFGEDGKQTSKVFSGSPIEIRFSIDILDDIDLSSIMMNCCLCDAADKHIVTFEAEEYGFKFINLKQRNSFSIHLPSMDFRPGAYFLSFQFSQYSYDPSNWLDYLYHAIKIDVENSKLITGNWLSTIKNQPLIKASFEYTYE